MTVMTATCSAPLLLASTAPPADPCNLLLRASTTATMLPLVLRQSSLANGALSLARIASCSSSSFSTAAAGPATAAPAAAAASAEEPAYAGPPKLVVFGGRGFVGSAVCKEALKTGLHVVSISPSGTPPTSREPWTREVEWLRGNALEPRTYQGSLAGALGAISCIGGFGSQAEMLKVAELLKPQQRPSSVQVNGTANAAAIATSKAAGIPRFVYISAQLPPVPGLDYVLAGYVQGKKQAEEELLRSYPDSGVVLRPWVIYGDRVVSSAVTLPLGAVFGPVEYALKHIPNAKQLSQLPVVGGLFLPPVDVAKVASVAVAAATDASVPPGIMDNWQISDF